MSDLSGDHLPAPLAGAACACARHVDPARRQLFTGLVGLAGAAAGLAPASDALAQAKPAADPECKRSALTGAVSAETVEGQARQQYLQLMREAQSKNALAGADDPQLQRLRYIAGRIIPFTPACNARARDWRWEVQLLRSNSLNAFCMPGGKIAFFTGILARLKLSDDEVAMIMGHEAAHALLEHAREQFVKSTGTSVGLRLLSALLGFGNLGDLAAQGTAQLLSLKFGRDDEGEADALGLLLAARAGYDPRAGVSLWQKMGQVQSGNAPPAWLSTHPAGPARTREIQQRLPRVVPEFDRAAAPDRRFPVAG
ncbi:MAG: M48 family metallopeptidase [Betaproteobacteria bacterium]|nr:M48 family metallopeptidase [Betaproteobacteria bacterium]MCC6250608.1 M48 family metallopeptidase [Rubrivivax sp.]